MMLKIILFTSFICLGLSAEQEDCSFDGPLDRFLPNLVRQARISEECFNKSREIFGNGFPLVKLEGPFDDPLDNEIKDINFLFSLKDIDDVNDAFYFFGDLIQYLHVDFKNISVKHAKEIIRRVNNHCSSLTSLNFKNVHGNILDDLSGPFPTITSFEFSIDPTEKFTIKPNSKKFHEIFPKVNFLLIGNMTSADEWKFIRETPKSLLFVKVIDELDEANEANLVEFIRRNPNVMSLEINFASRRLLNKLNDVLGNLVSLGVKGISQDFSNDGEVHIRNQFSFKFTSKSENDTIEQIYLHKIKELTLEIPYSIGDNWMQFLKNQVNKDLNKLQLKTENLSKEQLFAIVKSLPNLKEIDIELTSQFAIEDLKVIEELLKKGSKLKIVTLRSDLSEWQTKELGEILDGKCTVTYEKLNENRSVTTIRRLSFGQKIFAGLNKFKENFCC